MSLGPLGLMIEHIRGVTKGSKYCKDFWMLFDKSLSRISNISGAIKREGLLAALEHFWPIY